MTTLRLDPPREWLISMCPPFVYIAALSLAQGMSYGGLFGWYAKVVHPVEELIPIPVWSVAWTLVGVAAVCVAFCPAAHRVKNVVYTAWTVLSLTWATSWFVAWATGEVDRGVNRALWYGLAPFMVGWASWAIRQYMVKLAEAQDTIRMLNKRLEVADDSSRTG